MHTPSAPTSASVAVCSRVGGGHRGAATLRAREPDQLGAALVEPGHHSLHTYLDEDGEPVAQLTKRKLRQNTVEFAMGTYHVTDSNEEVAAVGLQLCTGVGIRGVANPEFTRDARDGRVKLIERNRRLCRRLRRSLVRRSL
jgi:hypothetical protein